VTVSEIVITEFMDEAPVEGLAADYDVLFDPTLIERPDDILASLADARAIIVRNRTQVRAPLLDAAPNLIAVGRLGVGLDNIDVDECKKRGVAVLPATGANADTVAEYVIGAAIILLRGVFYANARVIAGEWPRTDIIGREAGGRRIGLVGFGDISRAVARKAAAIGMTVAAYDPFVAEDDPSWGQLGVECRDLDGVLADSDVVSLHVPLIDATRHIIDAAAIDRMRPGAILVNAARGGVIDEAAVCAALHDGRLGGAAIDVFEDEPVTDGSAFIGVPNLILTPHVAGLTGEAMMRVSILIADRVRAALEGRPA
jgi:(S)-sulfolactate dehydrogenase